MSKINKISKDRWASLIKEHVDEGKSVKDIIAANPDVKRTTFRYQLNKAKSESEPTDPNPTNPNPDPDPNSDSETQIGTGTLAEKPRPQIVAKRKEPEPRPEPMSMGMVEDTFLSSMNPGQFSGRPEPKSSGGGLVDSMFSMDDLFQPETLSKPIIQKAVPKAANPMGKGASYWFSSKKDKTDKPDPMAEDNEQLVLVQKIRLYFVHFPELSKLHIVTRKRGTDEPEVEKWLVSLYTKKVPDLEKTLNFVKFHVRNNINENTSIKLASNALETGVKVIEHVLLVVGVQSQNLTKNVMDDPDINRCIKEILIENSVHSLNLGPKADLTLKLAMKVVGTDSTNRIEQRIESQAAAKAEPKAVPKELIDRYGDL